MAEQIPGSIGGPKPSYKGLKSAPPGFFSRLLIQSSSCHLQTSWPQDLDRFILSKLETKKLGPITNTHQESR